MICLLLLAPITPGAADSTAGPAATVWSDDAPFRPLNIDWVELNGQPVAKGHHDVDDGDVRFLVRSPPKGLTFGGEFTALFEAQVVLIWDYTGPMFVSEGNVKFAGKAGGWMVCDDRDNDRLDSCDEARIHGTDPDAFDTDGDGLGDGDEVLDHGTNPLAADSDADGLDDGDELARGTDPSASDSDRDGLSDGDEVHTHGTDPLDADSDGGGGDDGTEVERGTDPLDPSDDQFITFTTQSGQGRGASPMDVEFAGPDHYTQFGDGNSTTIRGDVVFQPDGQQWLIINGTETLLEDDFRVEVFGFRGTVHKTTVHGGNGSQDALLLDGIAQSYRVRNFTTEEEVARGKIVVESDGEEQVLRVRMANVVNDEEVPVLEQELEYPVFVPVYFEFDVWKNPDNIADIGVFHVQMRPGTYEGQDVTYITIYNEDPLIYTGMVPVPLPVSVCVQTPPEFKLGMC